MYLTIRVVVARLVLVTPRRYDLRRDVIWPCAATRSFTVCTALNRWRILLARWWYWFVLICQSLLQSIDSLHQRLDDTGLRSSLLWYGIVDAFGVEDLASLASRSHTIAFYLALATTLAIHRLPWLNAHLSNRKTINGSSHRGHAGRRRSGSCHA